ncbi:MAG: hypothetical protein Q8Q38_01875 [bacterium]|nr:hypothetical protein [bacterium]
MNKEFLDKYSKISIIVIAVILLVSFIWVVYFKVFVPYQERLAEWKQDQKYFEASKKRQENQALLNKCYADAETASRQRKVDNCTYKTGTGPMTCILPSEKYPQFDYVDKDCSEYFYCSFDFLKSAWPTEQTERKNCEAKYPLNF